MYNEDNLSFIDALSIVSFCVGLQNLELNLQQEDLDNQTQELDKRLHIAVDDIQKHLQAQDAKIDKILEALDDKN